MTRAGRDQRKLAAHGFDVPISINISPKQFERPDFVSRLKNNLAQTRCPASRIEIEITESMLVAKGLMQTDPARFAPDRFFHRGR